MRSVFRFLFFILILNCIGGCTSDAEFIPKDYPYVITGNASDIDPSGVTFNAKVYFADKQNIIDYGFVLVDKDKDYKCSLYDKNNKPMDGFSARLTTNLKKNELYSYYAYVQTDQERIKGAASVFVSQGSQMSEIESIIPNSGFSMTRVKLVGKNFSSFQDSYDVFFNDDRVDILHESQDSIVFKIPYTRFVGNATISLKSRWSDKESSIVFHSLGMEQ